MASLWKRPDSPNWICCYTDVSGKQLKRSTKEKNRDKALSFCQKLEDAARSARKDAAKEFHLKKLFQSVSTQSKRSSGKSKDSGSSTMSADTLKATDAIKGALSNVPSIPTLMDLAKRAGVSKTTASLALRDDTHVAKRTRERVRRAAKKIGYVRNTVAATLATQKSMPLAHGLRVAVISNYKRGTSGYEAHECDYRIVQAKLSELGYVSEHFNLPRQELTVSKLRSVLYHRGFSGIVFDEIREQHEEIFSLDWSPFSIVCMTRYAYTPVCNMVREDPFGIVTLAWQKIRAAGYRRIGFLLCRHTPLLLDDVEREAAFQYQQQLVRPPEEVVPPYLGSHYDLDAIRQWYLRYQPDVVVGFTQLHHFFLEKEMGLRIPQDVAYVNLLGQTSPHLAAVCNGAEEVAVHCAGQIDVLIRRNKTGYPKRPSTTIIAPTWIPGETMPPARALRSPRGN